MEFLSARSVEEALQLLRAHGEAASILAGGSDLMIQLARGEVHPALLVHIESIAELSGIAEHGHLTIGALTTHRQLATSARLACGYLALQESAASVGSRQTQEVGTLAGNICNASPAADTLPPLLVHAATVTLVSDARGERTLPLQDFLRGRRATARQGDELLTRIELERVPARTADVYCKVGRRSAMEVAIAGLAARLTLDEDGQHIEAARIATCAVGPVPCRATTTEEFLRGRRPDERTLREAGALLATGIAPIDDTRATARYRRSVMEGLLGRALRICTARVSITT